MQDLTIEQHEKEINTIQDQVRALYAAQQAHHDSAEFKRKLIPVVRGPNDIVLDPLAVGTEEGILAWMAKQPKNILDLIVKKHKGEE